MYTRLGIFLVVAAVISLQGCGGSDAARTYPVTGSVTLGGTAIEAGSIVFDPADGLGASAIAVIENGKFTGEIPAGEKILRISAVRTSAEKDEYGELITESYVPDKYNSDSELKRTVEANAENRFDLVLD